jgi:hypothetical protein
LAEKRYLEFPVVSRSRKQVQDDLFKQVIAGKGPPDETDGEEPIIAADPLAQSRLRAQGLPSTDRPAAGSIAEQVGMESGFGEAVHEPLTDLWRLSTQALPELAAQSIPYNLGDILDREALVKSGLIYPPGGPPQFDPEPDLLALLKGEASVTETKEALIESFHERSPAGQMAVVGQYDLSNLLPIPVGRAKFGQKALAESVAKLGRGKPVFVPGARGAVAPSGVPRFRTPLALPLGTGRTAEGAIISPGQMRTFPTPKVPVAPVEHSLVIVTPQKPLGEKLIFANKRNGPTAGGVHRGKHTRAGATVTVRYTPGSRGATAGTHARVDGCVRCWRGCAAWWSSGWCCYAWAWRPAFFNRQHLFG